MTDLSCTHLPEGICDGCLENPASAEIQITTADANLLIQALHIWRSPQEDRLHDDRCTGFERKLVLESLAHVDSVIAKVQALEVKEPRVHGTTCLCDGPAFCPGEAGGKAE